VNPKNFFAELKRRNVYKVAVAYAVVAWLLMQIATQVFPFLEIPNWAIRLVIMLLALGFPVALILAWAFELTPEGIKRVEEVARPESITRATGRKLDFLIIGILLLVIGIFAFGRFGKRAPTTAAPSVAAAQAIPEKSIAVLPFENFSADKENAFFADGVQDDILTALAKVADLKVISRASVMSYAAGAKRNLREIGQALGVAHVLEGSVRRAGDKVRVSAQLVDTRTDGHLWADTYDRDLADVFAIQSDIAQQIADQLQAKLSPSEKSSIEERPTKDITAYDLYLRAKALATTRVVFNARAKDNLMEESRLLDQAIARDPDFFLAYCLLATTHGNLYFFGFDHTAERGALAQRAVETALRLRPEAGEAHFARAGYLYRCYLDYDRARTELVLA
jgi:TolB-like protein